MKKKDSCRNIHEVCAILVARCGSSRRPEKVLADIGGINVLELIVHRLKISPHIKQIIVATTDDEKDDRIEKLTKQLKIDCFRGDKEDIVSRMHKASRLTNCELILEGILFIQKGGNPRILTDLLISFVPPKERESLVSTA